MTEITDKAFDLSQSINYTLSIRFVPNGFCFIVFGQDANKVICCQESSKVGWSPIEALGAQFEANPILKANYRQVLFLDDESSCTFVPTGVFSDADFSKVWKLNFGEEKEPMRFFSDTLRMADVVNIYALPVQKVSRLLRFFPSVKYVNRQSVHVVSSLMENKRHSEPQVFVNFYSDSMDVVLVRDKMLQLANSYTFRNDDEFLYFILNLYEHFALDQYNVETVVSGFIEENDSKLALLKRYVKQVRLQKTSSFLSGKEFENMPNVWHHMNLFNLPLCAL
ncbi:MAG: DUF3822 family protein [Paludibacteraceae bacterium]|nr:DUF3822 family protein [Paludibacteraceae bacterium]